MGKIIRQLGIEPQLLAGDGMDKAQRFGVQALPMQAGDAVVGTIDRVSRHRMMDGCHVYPDLVGTAGFQAAFQQGELAQPFQHLVAGVGILGVRLTGRINGHLLAVSLAAAQAAFHKSLVLRKAAVDDGVIGTLHAVYGHLSAQPDVRCIVLCHHQQAAGVLVDAVDDAGADLAANAGKAALTVPQQGVYQCAVRVAGGRMDHHALGFVDHQQVLILIHDVQRDVLRHRFNGFCIRDLQQDDVPCLELEAFGRGPAVAQHMPGRHQPL